MERRSFLTNVLKGLAAASAIPLVGKADRVAEAVGVTKESYAGESFEVRRWKSDGLHFTEFMLPTSVPPMFERDGDEVLVAKPSVYDEHAVAAGVMKRRYTIPVHNTTKGGDFDMRGFVSRVLNAARERGAKSDPKEIAIIRVKDRPELVGVMALDFLLVPVGDFYKGV